MDGASSAEKSFGEGRASVQNRRRIDGDIGCVGDAEFLGFGDFSGDVDSVGEGKYG